MTRAELEFYSHNVPAIKRALERIADALENSNVKNVHLNTGCSLDPKNLDHQVDEKYEAEQARLYTDDIKAQDDAINETFKAEENEELDTQHDYLHQLVQNLKGDAYLEFCNEHCLPSNDAVAVSNYITDLDYEECLGAIKELEEANHDQANEDAVTYDDDYDLRCTAKMYNAEIHPASDIRTKKDAILDYVTNEFGSQGARYTDIIKFAYYLNHANGSKFDSTRDRGYYSLGMSGRNPYLVHGGKDHLVKGINKDGDERYFALSFVESVTDYWKHIK